MEAPTELMTMPLAPMASSAHRTETFNPGKEPEQLTATGSPAFTPHCVSISTIMAAMLGLAADRLDGRLPRVVVISV